MKRNARSCLVALWLLLPVAVPASAAPADDYVALVTSDYANIADHLNGQLARFFGFYSTLGWMDGPGGLDLMKGPHVEFGAAVGADLVKVDASSVPLSVLQSASNVDIPTTLPLPYPAWHLRAGLVKGLDVGLRGTGFPRYEKNDISIANRGFGFAIRYLALHGPASPDVSVQVTWDTMKGDFSFGTGVDQSTPYENGGVTYTSHLTGRTVFQEVWNVRSFGVKAMVGKTVGIFHPYAALGVQRHAGTSESRLYLALSDTILDASNNPVGTVETSGHPLVRSAAPPITQPKYMVGFELGTGFLWSNLFETNGHDYAVATGFRAQI